MKHFIHAVTTIAIALSLTIAADAGVIALAAKKEAPARYIIVQRAVDGDTLKLANGERVRLIGVDTPEVHESVKLYRDARKSNQDVATIQALGKKAAAFTKGLVEGKPVRLEFDVQKKDRYGRLLAYVYLENGTFLNAEIIRQGYANVMTIPPNVRYQDLFLKLYREAREAKRGLWKD